MEVLQTIALATSPTEMLAGLLDSIPIVGSVASFGVELANFISNTAYSTFVTVDSQQVRDTLACELFCLSKSDCEINLVHVKQVFEDNSLGVYPFLGSWTDKLQWLIDTVFTGEPNVKVAATIAQLGIFTIEHGGKFGQLVLGIYSLKQLAQLGMLNNPNNGYSIICSTCDYEWQHIFDFSLGITHWELDPDPVLYEGSQLVGEIDTGHGFITMDGKFDGINYWGTSVQIRAQFAETTLTQVTVHYDYDDGYSFHNLNAIFSLYEPGNNLFTRYWQDRTNGENIETWAGSEAMSELKIRVNATYNNVAQYGGTATIKKIIIRGLGTNPFI